jgi:hypothetical protein
VGSATFTLTNSWGASLPLTLKIGDFTDDTSQESLGQPKVTFTTETGGPVPGIILPGASVRITASISNMNRAGVASAPLMDGNNELGRLRVVDVDAPLDISIGDLGTDERLALTHSDTTILTVKNGDGEAYPVDWTFLVDGKMLQNGELQLAPHGTAQIELIPTDDLYSWTDNVRPARRAGTLHVSLHGPPEIAKELLPDRTLPVNLLMRKLSPGWTSVWLYSFVALLLLLGGLLSLVGNSVLPNIRRKIGLRKQIDELADRTGGIEGVDPYLRLLLRVERKRIEFLVKKSRALSLSSGETLDQGAAGVERLDKRLKATERMAELHRRLIEALTTAPVSITDEIDTKLRQAAEHLHSFALPDEEINAANRLMDTAEALLSTLSNTEALTYLIAARFRDLKVRQKSLPYTYYHDLKMALPGLFEMLNQPFEDPKNITRQMIFAIDYGIAALQLAFDYSVLRISVPASASGLALRPTAEPQLMKSPRERLLAHHQELITLLGTLSPSSLRELKILVQEMRENIYERDVLDEIANTGQAEVALDPKTVRPFIPSVFFVRFKDPRFNDAAAMRRLTCKWDFPNHLVETDWKACHFFQGNEVKRDEGPGVTVSVRVESNKPAESLKASSVPLKNSLSTMIEIHRSERPVYSQAFAGGTQFMIALGVAFAALLSGALQQLDKLDFVPTAIAVLALGFGADTLKNLLMQTSRKASA